jgi:hypothetical protein
LPKIGETGMQGLPGEDIVGRRVSCDDVNFDFVSEVPHSVATSSSDFKMSESSCESAEHDSLSLELSCPSNCTSISRSPTSDSGTGVYISSAEKPRLSSDVSDGVAVERAGDREVLDDVVVDVDDDPDDCLAFCLSLAAVIASTRR